MTGKKKSLGQHNGALFFSFYVRIRIGKAGQSPPYYSGGYTKSQQENSITGFTLSWKLIGRLNTQLM